MSTEYLELEALLWSKKSKTFHLEKLSKTIEHGVQSFAKDADPDYIIVGISPTLEGIRGIREALTEGRPDWDLQP
jgi:hypothetical protein